MTTGTTPLKHLGDGVSIGTMLGAVAGYLPAFAALLTIIWTTIRIYETETVKKLVARWRKK
jgi:hypothetical protein